MSDHTARAAFSDMFRMLAARRQPNRALARWLMSEAKSDDYGIHPGDLGADRALYKLGITFDGQEPSENTGAHPTPAKAFAGMRRLFERDVREADDGAWQRSVANRSIVRADHLARYASTFDLPKEAITLRGHKVIAATKPMTHPHKGYKTTVPPEDYGVADTIVGQPWTIEGAPAPKTSLTTKIIVGAIVAAGVFLALSSTPAQATLP